MEACFVLYTHLNSEEINSFTESFITETNERSEKVHFLNPRVTFQKALLT